MKRNEIFNQDEHSEQIDDLFYPALARYLYTLKLANVPDEDISRIRETLNEEVMVSLRKTQQFVSFVKQIK